ncbi:MAG: biotin/lipoyl-containing protein [Kofleriaceae bacterium]|nr:biotin/lipoyl-containing protein [Kofleriaceae bacterium]
MTRLHEPTQAALAKRNGETWTLESPGPGYFYPGVTDGDLVIAGHAIGELDVLGRRIKLVAPDVQGLAQNTGVPRAVSYGDALFVVDTTAQVGGASASSIAEQNAAGTTGLVFRAPTSGRFYGRPTPGKPAFVEVGSEVTVGTTVCLLEVMKTFNRVTYGGAGLPDRARVKAVLVADGADVTAGEPLLALE